MSKRAPLGLPPLDSKEFKKRKKEWIAIVLLSIVLVFLTFGEFKLSKLSNSLPFVNSIFFFGLLNVNLIILIGLVWLVFRNIGKLFIERRRKVLGARLKTKLVIMFLSISIIPTLVLFVISALYINSSFDKWFSLKIQNTLDVALEITQTYYRNTEAMAMHFADHLAKGISQQIKLKPDLEQEDPYQKWAPWIGTFLETQRELLSLDAVEFYFSPFDERVISQRVKAELPEEFPRFSLDILEKVFLGEKQSIIQHIGAGDLIRCLVPVRASLEKVFGVLVVNSYIPVSLVNKVDEIASVSDDYKDINPLKYPMKTVYLLILIMITLVIIFVAIWVGLFLAKELTVPLERLVYGAQAVGSGNLDVSISGAGHDEIDVLVDSFNKMTRDLKDNRERLTQATLDLEKRRMQLETVLSNVGTGVIVVERDRFVTTFNRAVSQILEIPIQDALGKRADDIFHGDAGILLNLTRTALESRSHQEGPQVDQWNYTVGDKTKALASVATPLCESGQTQPWGAVVVIDELTHLIKAQREAAWREVARRIAHEIKNPLTPIKLSAQRLQRRLGYSKSFDNSLLKECTDTIIKHVDEMKELVNEFSNFARFPVATLAPHDLNQALNEVVVLFKQAHPEVLFEFDTDSKLPIFDFDRDQIKRVLINLLDNAISALTPSTEDIKVRNIGAVRIETHYNGILGIAVILVKDNGLGMDDETKERVFEPYFSTKTGGTGLGLAIIKRIINDHDGFIRVTSALAEGTQFFIELPTRRGI